MEYRGLPPRSCHEIRAPGLPIANQHSYFGEARSKHIVLHAMPLYLVQGLGRHEKVVARREGLLILCRSLCFRLLCVLLRSPADLSQTLLYFRRNWCHCSFGDREPCQPTAPGVCLQQLLWPSMAHRGFRVLLVEEVCTWWCLFHSFIHSLLDIYLLRE